MVFAGAPFAVIPLFKLYDCFIAGSGYVVRGIAGVAWHYICYMLSSFICYYA